MFWMDYDKACCPEFRNTYLVFWYIFKLQRNVIMGKWGNYAQLVIIEFPHFALN